MTGTDEPAGRDRQRRVDEAIARYLELQAEGQAPDPEAWLAANPELVQELSEFLSDLGHLQDVIRRQGEGGDAPLSAAEDASDIGPRSVIAGRYTLLEQIGRGGMGEVWIARQSEPVQRKVAIKLIKPGMDSASVLARFEAERQALAIMDHPNIANVLDGGVTRRGRPYFVMELVNGLPLTKFCDDAKLTPRERLELFVPICQAVQHAHHKGIVHRDLKPSNILVTLYDGRPVPKIIDFGVAKAIGGKLTAESLSTEFGAVVGTLEYMSPEQAGYSGLDVDTRADIYSLGVLLYELLTGLRPIDAGSLHTAALGHMLRLIQEQEPAKPSTRLSTDKALPSLAALRRTEPRRLTRLLRGELDCIVMKCLEKDRNRRYETANGLSQDVQRYLEDEPVLARPPSTGYRLRKFVRRNKTAVVSGAVVVASLVAAVFGTSLALVRTRAAERRATIEAKKAVAVRDFLAWDLLRKAHPKHNPHSEHVTVEQLLDRASEQLDTNQRFADEPDVEQEIRAVIADTYLALGKDAKSVEHWRRALSLARELYGNEDESHTLIAMNGLGLALTGADQLREAEDLLREVLTIRRRLSGPTHTETLFALNNLGIAVGKQGRLDEAEALLKQHLKLRMAAFGAQHEETLRAHANIGKLLEVKGDYAGSEATYRTAVEGYRALGQTESIDALISEGGLATALVYQGKFAEGQRAYTALIEKRSRLLGPNHPQTLAAHTDLSYVLGNLGRPEDSAQEAALAYEGARETLGEDHRETLLAKNGLVLALRAAQRWDEAERLAKELVAQAQRPGASDELTLLRFTHNLGFVLEGEEKYAQAEQAYRDCLAIAAAAGQSDHVSAWDARHNLARTLYSQERYAEAAELARETLDARKRHMGAGHGGSVSTALTLAKAYQRLDRVQDAEAVLWEVLSDPQIDGGEQVGIAWIELGHNLLGQDRPAEAIEPLRRCLAIRERLSPQQWPLSQAQSELGAALTQTKEYAEAEKLLLAANAQLEQAGELPPEMTDLGVATRRRLALLYEAWGRSEDAARWREDAP